MPHHEIRTPDQRLRIFISSTIAELADERSAARAAIEKLRLTPVYFESGARPHPPQELYRSYLQQSEVFVGIYAASYGWVAPGSEISGVEDEYRLSAGKPRLIYVKNVAKRDERLSTLLAGIQSHGAVCYQKFHTAAELAELLQNDLALLLAESFDAAARSHTNGNRVVAAAPLPVVRGKSVGRERELAELRGWIEEPHTSLVTLTGPGGTGKSRIALQLAHNLAASFTHGAVFVALGALSDGELVAPTIARSLGLFDTGQRRLEEFIAEYLQDKSMLIVLDNFEHVLGATTIVTALLEQCGQVKILATSRAPLHLTKERVFQVDPLDAACDPEGGSVEEILDCPAVQLFVMRARDSDPSLQLSEQNVRAIGTLCSRLDGLPLAIELAASRTRMLPPVALRSRIDRVLDLLGGGARDLPERQRTMRATLAWSYDLLDGESRGVFRRLSAFNDSWTVESAEDVAGDIAPDILESIARLVDLGLVRRLPFNPDDEEVRFTLLQVVRSFAREQAEQSGEWETSAARHAAHFTKLAEAMERERSLTDSVPLLGRMEKALPDIRSAFWHWIAGGNRTEALSILGSMRGVWFYLGVASEAVEWLNAVCIDDEESTQSLPPEIAGRALLAAGLITFVSSHLQLAHERLTRSGDFLRRSADKSLLPRALAYLGVVQLSMGDKASLETLREAAALGRDMNDGFAVALSLAFASEAHLLSGDLSSALATVEESVRVAKEQRARSAHAVAVLHKANLLFLQRRASEAAALFREAIGEFEAVRMRAVRGWAHWGLAYASYLLGDTDEVRRQLLASLELGRSTGDEPMLASTFLGMALFAVRGNQYSTAAALLEFAELTARNAQYSFWSIDRSLHEELTATLRGRLSTADLEAAFAQGRQLSREQALKLGMASVDSM